jgi:hypothetical protein
LIAALEDRFALGTAYPKIEADTIRLLFTARDVAPADTKVLGHVRVLEEALAQKTAMVDAKQKLLMMSDRWSWRKFVNLG